MSVSCRSYHNVIHIVIGATEHLESSKVQPKMLVSSFSELLIVHYVGESQHENPNNFTNSIYSKTRKTITGMTNNFQRRTLATIIVTAISNTSFTININLQKQVMDQHRWFP